MAITKLKEIRSTLDKAIQYICNPDKTEGQLLVDSYQCSPGTAAAQMELTESYGTHRGNRKAYHLIQSFAPDDDITPEKALEIGKQYADLVTGGKYEYVIATHIDKGHIHNHIIFNATSCKNYRKYHHGKDDIQRIRDLSDRLCYENNLSVITETSGRRGKNHKEYQESKVGNSWKDRLADLIDTAVFESKTFEEFLEKMEFEGVDVRQGKHISFKCELLGQKRASRGKTIGKGYTEEAIRARIARDEKYLSENNLKSPEELKAWKEEKAAKQNNNISEKSGDKVNANSGRKAERRVFREAEKNTKIKELINLEKYYAEGKSDAYINKLQKSNIDNFSKFINFMHEKNLVGADDLVLLEKSQRAQIRILQKTLDSKMPERMEMQKKYENVRDYIKYKKNYIEYKKQGSKAAYREVYQKEIDLFLKAEAYLKKIGIDNPGRNMLNEIFSVELTGLNNEIKELRENLKIKKNELRETAVVRLIYEETFGESLSVIDDLDYDNYDNATEEKERTDDGPLTI